MTTFAKLTSLFTITFALMLSGCQSASPMVSEDGGPPKMESATLTRPLGGMVAEAVLARADAGKPLPEDYKTPEFVNSVVDAIRTQFPAAFAVTEDQEKALAAGNFDDAVNAEKLSASLADAEKAKLPLSTLSGFLFQQHKEGKLKGIHLEIARRLFAAQLAAPAPAADAPKQ